MKKPAFQLSPNTRESAIMLLAVEGIKEEAPKMKKRRQYTNLIIAAVLIAIMWVVVFTYAPQSDALQDPMLENAIRVEAGVGPNEPLGPQQYESITSLDAEGYGVENLQGLTQMPNLEELNLRDNDIEDISILAELDGLVELDLRENNISDISPLSGLTMLQDLNLRENNINDIEALSSLTEIRDLNIRDNDIDDISPLAEMPLLRDLNIRNNRIASIEPLGGLENLVQRIYLEGNPVNDYSPIEHYYYDILDTDFLLEEDEAEAETEEDAAE